MVVDGLQGYCCFQYESTYDVVHFNPQVLIIAVPIGLDRRLTSTCYHYHIPLVWLHRLLVDCALLLWSDSNQSPLCWKCFGYLTRNLHFMELYITRCVHGWPNLNQFSRITASLSFVSFQKHCCYLISYPQLLLQTRLMLVIGSPQNSNWSSMSCSSSSAFVLVNVGIYWHLDLWYYFYYSYSYYYYHPWWTTPFCLAVPCEQSHRCLLRNYSLLNPMSIEMSLRLSFLRLYIEALSSYLSLIALILLTHSNPLII
jgi:hypothetical protein